MHQPTLKFRFFAPEELGGVVGGAGVPRETLVPRVPLTPSEHQEHLGDDWNRPNFGDNAFDAE